VSNLNTTEPRVLYLAACCTKSQLINLIDCNQSQQKFAEGDAYKNLLKQEEDTLQNLLKNFDKIASSKAAQSKLSSAEIDFLNAEGFDEDGNEYDCLQDWLVKGRKKFVDNTPHQKSDDLNN
jgi:hypothetical protein